MFESTNDTPPVANGTGTRSFSRVPDTSWLREEGFKTGDGRIYSHTVEAGIFKVKLLIDKANLQGAFVKPQTISCVITAIDKAFRLIEQSQLFPGHLHRKVSVILSDSTDLPIYYGDDGVTLLIEQSLIESSLPSKGSFEKSSRSSGASASPAGSPGTDRIVATLLNYMAMVVYEACDPDAFWAEFRNWQHGNIETPVENDDSFIPSSAAESVEGISTKAVKQIDFIAKTLPDKWRGLKLPPASDNRLSGLLPRLFNPSLFNSKTRPGPLRTGLRALYWHSEQRLEQIIVWLNSRNLHLLGNDSRAMGDYFEFMALAKKQQGGKTHFFQLAGNEQFTHLQKRDASDTVSTVYFQDHDNNRNSLPDDEHGTKPTAFPTSVPAASRSATTLLPLDKQAGNSLSRGEAAVANTFISGDMARKWCEIARKEQSLLVFAVGNKTARLMETYQPVKKVSLWDIAQQATASFWPEVRPEAADYQNWVRSCWLFAYASLQAGWSVFSSTLLKGLNSAVHQKTEADLVHWVNASNTVRPDDRIVIISPDGELYGTRPGHLPDLLAYYRRSDQFLSCKPASKQDFVTASLSYNGTGELAGDNASIILQYRLPTGPLQSLMTGSITLPEPEPFAPVPPLFRIDETLACPAFGKGYRTSVSGTEIHIRVYPQGDAAPPLRLVDITLDANGYRQLGYKDRQQALKRLVFDLEKLAGLFLYGGFNQQLLVFLRGLQVVNDYQANRVAITAEPGREFLDSYVTLANSSQPMVYLGLSDLSQHSVQALVCGLEALLVPAWRIILADSIPALAGIEQIWGITSGKLKALGPYYGLDEIYQARQWPGQSDEVYQQLVSGQPNSLRKQSGSTEDFEKAVRWLYRKELLAPALGRVVTYLQQPETGGGTDRESVVYLFRAITVVHNEQPVPSERRIFRTILGNQLDWLLDNCRDNREMKDLGQLRKNDVQQQDGYEGLVEPEQVLPANLTHQVNGTGRFFTLKALDPSVGVYLPPGYQKESGEQTLKSDLQRLVDASALFRHRVGSADNQFRKLLGNATAAVRPDTLGDLHDLGLLEVTPDERDRAVPQDYLTLVVLDHKPPLPENEPVTPLTYLRRTVIQNSTSMQNNTVGQNNKVTNRTVNNGTFTVIHFYPDSAKPLGFQWLSDNIPFFYQLSEAIRLATGSLWREEAIVVKNRIRSDLNLPQQYSGRDKLPLPVVDPGLVMVKETLPVQVRFNQTEATRTRKSERLAVTQQGRLGPYLEVTAEPDENGYRLGLSYIGRTDAAGDGHGMRPWLRRWVTEQVPTHRRVRRADDDEIKDKADLINELIPDSKSFEDECKKLLRFKRLVNPNLNDNLKQLIKVFKELDQSRHADTQKTFSVVFRLYDKLTSFLDKYQLYAMNYLSRNYSAPSKG